MPAGPGKAQAVNHPTKERLLDTVARMLTESGLEGLTVDGVLHESGVSRGSLYHHFEDFPDLLEQALVQRFSANVNKSIAMLTGIVRSSKTKEETISSLRQATVETTSSALAPTRMERAKVIGYAHGNPRLGARLGAEQSRLTTALAGLFRELQDKGWMSNDFDAKAAAVLIQSYALGRIVDDINDDKISDEAWCALINKLVDRVFMA